MAKDYAKSFSIGFVQGFGVAFGSWVASKVTERIDRNLYRKTRATAKQMEGFMSMVHDSTEVGNPVKRTSKVPMGFH